MSYARCFSLRPLLSLTAIVLLSAACGSGPVKQPEAPTAKEAAKPAGTPPAVLLSKAQQELASGTTSYENGAYKVAARQLQNALTLGLETPAEQARAHKYLAFMHCVGGSKRQCRDEFLLAIKADSTFDLTPAEAGHPTWGPVFRKLKPVATPAGKPAKK